MSYKPAWSTLTLGTCASARNWTTSSKCINYWIEAYKKTGTEECLDQFANTFDAAGKIKEDAFYNSIDDADLRQGLDYTVDGQGRVVAGSNSRLRKWSEY